MSAEPPVDGIPQYIDDTGTYFWNQEKGNYWNSTKGESYNVTSESKSKGDATYIFNGAGGIQGGFTLTPDRPDYDGLVTLGEANDWARNGNGEPLYVDIGKLDLSRVSVLDFAEYDSSTRGYFSLEPLSEKNYKWQKSIYFNFALPGGNSGVGEDPGGVFGTIKLTLLNRVTGDVRIGNDKGRLDTYNFESQNGRYIRNTLTWFGRQLATQLGTSNITTYDIFGYGKNKVTGGF